MTFTACSVALLASVAATLAPFAASAQGYPARTVRILIGTPAGGPGDTAARGAAQALMQAMGGSFIVENRVGGEGLIAGEAAVRSTPDGYTLYAADSFFISLNPVIRAKMPYDPAKDLTPIIHFGFLNAALLVHPSVPANSLRELLELARAKPESVSWGSFGVASSSNLYIEWLKNEKGIRFLNVPYKAASLAWPAMLAGEVNVVIFAVGPAAAQVRAGKARALAVTNTSRSPLLPDVPTLKEGGLEVSLLTWFGLFGPAGLPRDVVLRLNAEIAKGLINNAAAKEKFLTSQGTETLPPAGAPPDAFIEFLKAERESYAKMVRVAGVKIE